MSTHARHTVVLDVMGADNGPRLIIEGGLLAAKKLGDKLTLKLVGHLDSIQNILRELPDCPSNLSVEHAEQEVSMKSSVTEAVRMRDSSIAVGCRMVKSGAANAFVSPGNTGAVMGTAILTLGRIEGVNRPAISIVFPTSSSRPTVLLDVGANADCKPIHLSQFAVMGSVYSQMIFEHESPRVGLVSIGEERSKGNELIFGALELLRHSRLNFVGNIEGRDILSGRVDVAVTDGFTGNILLKLVESIKPMLVRSLQKQIQTNIFSRIAVMFMVPFLRRMKKAFDYSESGGAPLLGLNGVVIVCHGSSSARAVCNAIVLAHEMASRNINERIREEIAANRFGRINGTGNKSESDRDGVVCTASSDDQR